MTQEIQTSVSGEQNVCAETAGGPSGMVVFGASGDLSNRKLLPSVFRVFKRGLLAKEFYLIGCGRKEISDDEFRQITKEAIEKSGVNAEESGVQEFLSKLYYTSGDYDDDLFYSEIKKRLSQLDAKHRVEGGHIFYLAVPPLLYGTIMKKLGASRLSCAGENEPYLRARLVVEKPFGRDLQTATELNRIIHNCFKESQVYRIDHYMGKETVQNILMLRFANTIFEPFWNRNYIDNVQILIAESVGVENRASYYDSSGALRDMFQNHMLGMLALVAMESPVSFGANSVRDEKVKLLRSIRAIDIGRLSETFVRGQYGAGMIDGKAVAGYIDEPGVDKQSKTETFVAGKLFVDNWRWQGVPFYLRTGKRLRCKNTEIVITFKKVPHSMFEAAGVGELAANVLVMKIQPKEGLSLSFQAKRPGSKICMSTLNMHFSYSDVFGAEAPEAYQRLLLDCMAGDQMLFLREDDVEVSWKLLMPVLETWEKDGKEPYPYPAGSESFAEADKLLEADGRTWRKLGI